MKHPKRLGMSQKNTKFTKRGLTKEEKAKVEKIVANAKERWDWLLHPDRNRWKPIK